MGIKKYNPTTPGLERHDGFYFRRNYHQQAGKISYRNVSRSIQEETQEVRSP